MSPSAIPAKGPARRRRIVITGGTGFVGRELLARLAGQEPGSELLVPTRRLSAARALAPLPNVVAVAADVHDPQAMAPILEGADALVHLVAVLHGDAARFERVHVALTRQLASGARAAGVARVVHVSALGVAADAPSMYLRSKHAGELAWRDSGLAVTVLRPSVIFGAEDRFLNLFAQLQRVFPVMPLAGADARFQPVWVGDVAEAIVRALQAMPPLPPIIECAGPQEMTLRQIVQQAGLASGHARPVLALPAALGRVQALLLGLLPGEPLMSADNLRSMQVPNVASGLLPGLADIGIRPASLSSWGHAPASPSRRT
ncbi:MAG: complex I NDUFA9 subunit family protein [Aquabacterium sp.]